MKLKRSKYLGLLPLAVSLSTFFSSHASAQNLIITEPTDVWIEYQETTQFVANTYMVQGYNSDPMLWLYNEAGTLLASNDDYTGLQSYISLEVPAGRYRVRAGICCGDPNAWRTNGGWNLQYELGFNGAGSIQTTTTEPETTTTSTTTTSIPETTTTTSSTTTSTTTTSSTTTTTSTTSTTSTTVPRTTTTSTSTTTSTTIPETTTTSTTVSPTTTVEQTTTTTVEEPTTTTSLVSNQYTNDTVTTSSTSIPVSTTTTTTQPEVAVTTTTITQNETPIEPTQQVDPEVTALLDDIDTLPQSEIAKAVDNIIEKGVSSEEATALATNAEVLEVLTTSQATEIFDAVEVSELSDAQAQEIVDAVQNAPEEVKNAFESEINVYEGKFDSYVAVGSSVPVSTRRVIIAATGVLFAMPTVSAGKRGN